MFALPENPVEAVEQQCEKIMFADLEACDFECPAKDVTGCTQRFKTSPDRQKHFTAQHAAEVFAYKERSTMHCFQCRSAIPDENSYQWHKLSGGCPATVEDAK